MPADMTPAGHRAVVETAAQAAEALAPWMARWDLEPDGEAFTTLFGSRLAPVRHAGAPAMLKLAGGEEERDGGALMAWWAGEGAARVLARDGDAILMERAQGGTLAALVRTGRDEEATAILCRAAARLHAPRPDTPPTSLRPLALWFQALWPAARTHGGVFTRAAQTARTLLDAPQGAAVLHGDLHHDNVLDFGPRGWLVIDPKGLVGDRGYDHANLFCNPWPEAAEPGRLRRRLAVASTAADIAPARLLRWIEAYLGLSAAWTLGDGGDPSAALRLAEIVAAELSGSGS